MAIENSVSTYFDLLSSIVLTFLVVACPLLNRGGGGGGQLLSFT